MALRNDIAEKKRFLVDGVEVVGLVSLGELSLEKGVIEVPEVDAMRLISNNIQKTPRIPGVFKIQKDSKSLTLFRNWYLNAEVHDVTVIRTDAAGNEFARTQARECECNKYTETEFDAANPTFAKVTFELCPYSVTPMAAI